MQETLQIERKHEVLSLVTNVAFSNVPSWYGSTRRDLCMDLLVPKFRESHAPCPCIVWVCGGAYMVVDRSVWIPEMLYFARAGYVVASIEYRTSNEARFPAPLIDAKAAVRYLKAHAGEYCIDPERVYIMGESAGGTLASLVGTTAGRPEFEQGDWLDQDSSVRAVVDFYGPSLIEETSCNTNDDVPYWTMEAFLGPRFTPEQAKRASAAAYVTPASPPFMILHGQADPLIPLAQSEHFYEALKKNGVDVEFLILESAGHGDDRFYQDAIKDRILDFLKRH
ncbi:MAG: alpha/beta hydrolase [Oscillospiraceae bacterium]|nr:alpha/beta hydrolase [Oscillospiraceae bacterium]